MGDRMIVLTGKFSKKRIVMQASSRYTSLYIGV